MKKTVLAAATLSVLMASGMANAAFTDAASSGAWSGDLEFNGTITNTNPSWKYQIPEESVSGAKNWNVDRARGTVNGSNTNFSFPRKLTVLEGVMKEPSQTPATGLQPVITFGDGAKVVWDTSTQQSPASITVAAKNGETTVGSMTMELAFEVATQSKPNGTERVPDSSFTAVPDAYNLLKSQPYWATAYASAPESQHQVEPEWTQTTKTLAYPSDVTTSLSSALVAGASKFKLSVPTESIPDTWSATLPISITVK